jgi:hypothetical protein
VASVAFTDSSGATVVSTLQGRRRTDRVALWLDRGLAARAAGPTDDPLPSRRREAPAAVKPIAPPSFDDSTDAACAECDSVRVAPPSLDFRGGPPAARHADPTMSGVARVFA